MGMISLRNIKAAFVALLNQTYPAYAVHFDNVEKQDAPYFYVEMQPIIHTVDRVYSERTIQVDITFVPAEDKYGRVDRAQLYDIADALDGCIRPVFYVEDRAITAMDAETTIHDDILHYIFNLEFADYREAKRLTDDLMGELQITIKGE